MIKLGKSMLDFFNTQRKKIRVRLFVTYFIIIIILVTGIGLFSYYYSSSSIDRKIQRADMEIINQINRNMEFKFTQLRNLMLLPYNNSDYIAGVNIYSEMDDLTKITFQRKLNDFFLRNFYITPIKDLEAFYLYTGNGSMIFSSTGTREDVNPQKFKKLDWVKRTIKKDGDIYFSGSRWETIRGSTEEIFSTSIMIKDIANRKHFSIVRADLNFDEISKICSNAMIGKASETSIIDEEGNVIYSTGGRKLGSRFDRNAVEKMKEDSGTMWVNTDKGKCLLSYTKSDISGWNIVYMVPQGDIFDASLQIRRMTILISIIGLILTGIISMFFSMQITKPLLKLNRMIDSVRRGDLSIRMDEDREDEIGRIYSTYNALIEEVNLLIENKYVYMLKEKQFELNLLYAQINPHFLYNTLDTIKVMADIGEVSNVSQMISALASMLRYGVMDINEKVTVRQELEHIEDYMSICRLRFSNRVDFSMNVDYEVMDCRVARLILQPIIENCIHHGRDSGKDLLYIHITGSRIEDRLVFTVTDDGTGMVEETLDKLRQSLNPELDRTPEVIEGQSHRIGLANINNRLRLLYGEQEFISVSSWKGIGTEVKLSIPVLEEPNASRRMDIAGQEKGI